MPFVCVLAKRWDGPTSVTGHEALNEDVVSLLNAQPKRATPDGPYRCRETFNERIARFETQLPPVKVLDCLESLGFKLITQTLNANTSGKMWTLQKK